MRESYDMKIWRLQRAGKISADYARELIGKHREELDKRRMFSKGEQITTLEELLNETFVILHGRTWHIEAVKSLQMRIVLDWVKYGRFYKAIRKDDNVKFDRKECEGV